MFSLGGGGPTGVAVRDRATQDLNYARLYLAGPVITADSPEEATERVNAIADTDVDIIKIRVDDNLGGSQKMPPDVFTAVIDAAHARDLRVAAHLYYLDDAKQLISDGQEYQQCDDISEIIWGIPGAKVCVCKGERRR